MALEFVQQILEIGFTSRLSLHIRLIRQLVRISETFPIISLERRPFPIFAIPRIDWRVWIQLERRRLSPVMVVQPGGDNFVLARLLAGLAQKTPTLGCLAP